MGLLWFAGSAGSGKSRALFAGILQKALERPGERFFVIVPEQFTLQTQISLTSMSERGALLNVDVLSFERLAYRVFDELGIERKELLEEIGKTFLLEKIVLSKPDGFPAFGEKLKRPGNIEELKSILSELKQYLITPKDLAEVAKEAPTVSAEKLRDLEKIFRAYEEALGERYRTQEEVMTTLAKVLPQSRLLSGATVAFDGFTGFTPAQYRVLSGIFSLAKEIQMTVTIDPKLRLQTIGDGDLFSLSAGTMRKVGELADEAQIPQTKATWQSVREIVYRPELNHLEANLFREKAVPCPFAADAIRIRTAANPRAEVEEVARSIRRLVRKEGLRYRDIAVVSGDPEVYGDLFREVFRSAEIPCFLDKKTALNAHPFIVFLEAALAVAEKGYRYEDVFRMLKSGMTDLDLDEIDRLENYVLLHGIRGKQAWETPFAILLPDETEEEICERNRTRERVLAILAPIREAVSERASTVRKKTEALYRICVAEDLQNKLEERRRAFEENGQADLALSYAQVYGKTMRIFDQLVEILGDEPVSIADYRALLLAGLSRSMIGLIPPGTDEVMIGDMLRSRFGIVKALFFVGMNDGLVPPAPKEGGILTERERILFANGGYELSPDPRTAIGIQRFYLYLTLNRPTQYLFLSCASAGTSGDPIRPSFLIETIDALYPDRGKEPEDPLSKIESVSDGIGELAGFLSSQAGSEVPKVHQSLYAWFLRNQTKTGRLRRLLLAAGRKNPKDHLEPSTAAALYGEVLSGSATRLERFSKCAFSFYMQYGLRLRERPEYEFRPLDYGQILHNALEIFGRSVNESGRSWGSLSEEERNALADESVRSAASSYRAQTLWEDAGFAFLLERMKHTMRTTVWALGEQLSRSAFRPAYLESAFQNDLLFELSDGSRMRINGRIDRVDLATDGDGVFVKILDYKSGSTRFRLPEVYAGTQLQLPLYLREVVEEERQRGKTAYPAAVFYYDIKDPILPFDPEKTAEELDVERLRELRVTGVFDGSQNVVKMLDKTLGAPGNSLVIPHRVKKDGSFYPDSKALLPDQMQTLLEYAGREAVSIGDRIREGHAHASPVEQSGGSACRYCPYQTICGFDLKIPGYRVRNLMTEKKEELIETMKLGTYHSTL